MCLPQAVSSQGSNCTSGIAASIYLAWQSDPPADHCDDPLDMFLFDDLPVAPTPLKRPRHRVSFSTQAEVIPNQTASGEWTPTWYEKNELQVFRVEARQQFRQMRGLIPEHARGTPQLAASSSTRGLEFRACLERQRRKFLSKQMVLKMQGRLAGTNAPETAERLATVYRRCTAYAGALAAEEATRDFFRAYLVEDGTQSPAPRKRQWSGADHVLCNHAEAERDAPFGDHADDDSTSSLFSEDSLRRVRPRLF